MIVIEEQRKFIFVFAQKETHKDGNYQNFLRKELIIEWEDYQAGIAEYVYCKACEDLIESEWFNHVDENFDGQKYQNPNDSKQLLRFVKSPGLKLRISRF